MSQGVPAQKPRSVLSARRFVLMASAAVIGAGVLFSGAEFTGQPHTFLAPAYAETAQRPVGFADIVEKVKPAVISVRVKMDGGTHTMSFDGGDSPFTEAAKQLVEARRDVVELRPGARPEITLVRPDGYIAYSAHGHDPMAALESVRSVLEKQTRSSAASAGGSAGRTFQVGE